MAATIGMNGLAAYGASKAALESLTKAWTAEYAAQGVRINTVAPGPTRTPVAAAMGEMVRCRSRRAHRPAAAQRLTRSPTPSPSSLRTQASYIYGAILPADGGRVAV